MFFCQPAAGPPWLAALALFLLSAHPAQAQTGAAGAQSARPKIGLALSGGGARGAAHVGVLQVLEEQRIPVDFIAGTSMGAIVGSMYATGMTTDELTDALQEIDWGRALDDLTPRQDRSFRRKRDDDLYLVKSRPGIDKNGLKLPAGVIQGQRVDLVIARYLNPASHIEHFDNFAIPFRAIATDIVTGKAVVLESGHLPLAIRASMSVPALFSPALIDGRQLVDGGVANNLPIDVVREMGADVVIAVDISTPLRTTVDSVLAVTEQLTGILTRRNTEAQISAMKDEDVLIVPDLTITSADFERMAEAIPSGRAALQEHLEKLRHLSLSEADYEVWRAGRQLPGRAPPTIEFIRIDNRSRLKDSIIANRIVDSVVGQAFDVDAVERDVGRIYGLELFQNVGYDVIEENDKTGLEFSAHERAWGPGFLQLGATYSSNGDGDNLFNVAAAYLRTGLNPSGGEIRIGLQVGEEPASIVDYHQPLGRDGMYFFSAFGFYGDRIATAFEDDVALAEFRIQETHIESSFGRELGTWGELRAGLRYADGDVKVNVGDPLANPGVKFQRGEIFARFFVDELNSFNFPTGGYLTEWEWTASRDGLGADQDFEQLEVTAFGARTWGAHTLLTGVQYGSTISGHAPIQSVFRLGGFATLAGFNENELSGQHYAIAEITYYRSIGGSRLLPVYLGASVETGNVWQNRDDIGFGNRIYAGSLFAGADTPIGPIYVAYGMAEGGADAFYVFLGRPF